MNRPFAEEWNYWKTSRSEAGDHAAAERQAATFLFHHIKAAVLASQIIGNRPAFMQFLPDETGRPMMLAVQDASAGVSESRKLIGYDG